MSAQSKRRTCFQVKPPISDAVPPFKEARKKYALSKLQQQQVMETLGCAVYEYRQKVKAPAILTALPKGYAVEYKKSNYKFSGHPSKLLFYSISSFLEHLLWLEAMSHPKSIEPRRKCKCVVCTKIRNKGRSKEAIEMQDDIYHELTTNSSSSPSDIASSAEASASSEPASPMPASLPASAASTPKPSASKESTPDSSKTIRIYPLTRVLIEQHVDPHYYYPEKFAIPLPKIHKSDESILLKSLHS